MDTKYFHQALEEAFRSGRLASMKVGDLTMGEVSLLLKRAQELKDADKPQPNHALDRMGA